jgi:hypothetical protein
MRSSPRSFHGPSRALAAAAVVAATFAPTAAAAPQVWGAQVGTGAGEGVYGVAFDGSGGSYECGFTLGSLGGPYLGQADAFLTRRGAGGGVLWSRKVATLGSDLGRDVASDGAGGVYLAGDVAGAIGSDSFVSRFDGAGNELWKRFPAAADYEYATACAFDGAGGVFVTGVSFPDATAVATGKGDAWLARYDGAGNQLWLRNLGTSMADTSARVLADGSGGAFLCGSTGGSLGGPLTGSVDAWLARFDGAGNSLWIRQFGTPALLPEKGTRATGLAADGAGGIYLSGSTDGALPGHTNQGLVDAFVGRFDGLGNTLWLKQLGTDQIDDAEDAGADGSGGVWLLGQTQGELGGASAGNFDVWLAHYDGAGTPGSKLQLGSKNLEISRSIASEGTSLIAGGESSGNDPFLGTSTTTYNGWVARFDDCDLHAFAGYCTAGINSLGVGSTLGRSGSPYLSHNDFGLFANHIPFFEIGVFLMATSANSVPFGNGTLCVGGSVQRLAVSPPVVGGYAAVDLDFTDATSPASQITAGSTWYFQYWYRNVSGGGAGFNLSNGLRATFCP